MQLLIVSNMAHYAANGEIVTPWRAAAGEIDALASISEQVRHVAALHPGPAPAGSVPYRASNVRPLLLEAAGGRGFLPKLKAAAKIPGWVRTVRRELKTADAVQVRCPCNISVPTLALLAARRDPARRWVKYAGEWRSRRREPLSYRLQRALLRSGLVGAKVGVADPDAQRGTVRYVPNPSLSAADVARAEAATRDKRLGEEVRLLFAGRLDRAKGVERAIRILAELRRRGVPAALEIAGAGPDLERLQPTLTATGAASSVTFLGWLERERLEQAYARAHFVLLPSDTEGWAKALSEGLAFRAVPLASDSGGAPAILRSIGGGAALPPEQVDLWAERIERLTADPSLWRKEADRCRAAAGEFTYERYLDYARDMLAVSSDEQAALFAVGGGA